LRKLLSGIGVVELSDGVAGSYCAKLFADLGADVVKVEAPEGDPLRYLEHGPADADGLGRGGTFLHLNTNKRSVVIDPATAAGRARLGRLVTRSQLVVDATADGLAERFGLGWDELHERSPQTSVVRVSGFGATGPYARYRWDDLVVQSLAGSLLLQGRKDQDPLRLPGHLASCFVGSMAAVGGLAAAILAAATGKGSFVDCAAVEALATLPARQATLLAYEYRGRAGRENETSDSTETLIPTGVFPCGDGYMAMMSTPQQLGEMLEVLDDDDLRAAFAHPDAFARGETKEAIDAALYPWLLERTRAQATAAAQRVGWPLAGVNTPAEVLAADHLHQRGFWVHTDDPVAGPIDLPGPPCVYAEGGWSLRRLAPARGEHDAEVDEALPGAPMAALPGLGGAAPHASGAGAALPLEGIRVLDMTTVWSGPYATMLLADLGAEVIRVENPWVLPPTTKGYQARPVFTNLGFLGSLYAPPAPGRPDRPWNRHAMNNSLARNKLSCSIDNRRPEGRELLMRLAERSDVFIDNFKASGLARIGIEVSELQRRNPRLVIVRMPPTGTTGDWSGYTGFGAQFDGLTSLLWLCGHRGADLTSSPATTYMDGASGPATAFATIAALRYRAATGRGQVVEMAQSENVLNHLGDVFVNCQLGVEPERMGNRHPWRAPQGLYRCRDGARWLAVSVGDDREWAGLVASMGRPELAADPRYADAAGRRAHHDELDALIGGWAAGQDVLDAFHRLQRAGVPAGPLLDDDLFVADPQLAYRGWQRPLESADVGTHLHPGLAFTGIPQAWRRGSPTLGQDDQYVYKEILGVSDEDFERYRDERFRAEDYLDPAGQPY
jgi:crotonobetainyl-CoA:carnitine CoA-transferase CaiB-like acyl-CoA transferase